MTFLMFLFFASPWACDDESKDKPQDHPPECECPEHDAGPAGEEQEEQDQGPEEEVQEDPQDQDPPETCEECGAEDCVC